MLKEFLNRLITPNLLTRRKISALILFILFSVSGYSFIENDTVKKEKGNRTEWTIKNKNGNILEIIRMKNGKKDGIQEKFNLSGIKTEEVSYSNGNMDGLKMVYDYSGKLKEKYTYKYDSKTEKSILDGEFETYNNDYTLTKGKYKNNLKEGKYEEYYPGLKNKLIANYKNGLLEGLYSEYNNQGRISNTKNYAIISENGKDVSVLHGKTTFFDYNGNVSEEGNYVNGKKEGIWNSYSAGKLVKSVTWKNNLQYGEITEYQNEKIKKKYTFYAEYDNDGVILKNIFDGRLEEYYTNGNIARIENYKKGKKHGSIEEYYENGKTRSLSEFKEGLQTGKFEYWDINGNKKMESYFIIINSAGIEKSVKDGKELNWEDGVLSYEMYFDKGVETGERKSYHRNGKLMMIGKIKSGRYDGRVLEYYDNGKLKSDITYSTTTDQSGNLKSVQSGWRTEYDRNGNYANRYYHDKNGDILIIMNYFEGRLMHYTYKEIIAVDYFPDGKVMSFQILSPQYGGTYSHYFYWNGKTRKLKVQNADKDMQNHIDFTDNGEPFYSYSDSHENPKEKRVDVATMKRYAQTINPDLLTNSFFSDTVKDGTYQLHYAGGKLMAEMNFKNNFPEGKFIFFDPLGTDTLSYVEYSKGMKTGYYVQKFGGNSVYKRGRLSESGQTIWNETYLQNGLPYSKSTYDNNGKRIIHIEYYDNGKIKYKNNEQNGDYFSYDVNGFTISESVLLNEKHKIKKHTQYYNGTNQLKTVYFTRNGERDSLYQDFHSDGKLKGNVYYKNGKRNGTGESFDEKGKLISTGNYINDKPDGMFLQYKNGKNDTIYYKMGNLVVKPSFVSCACQDTKESILNTGFAPLIDPLISYSRLIDFLPDFIVPYDSLLFDHMFYTGLQNSTSSYGGFYSMNLMFFDTLAFFVPADEQLKITLNPCFTKGYRSRMEVSVNFWYHKDDETYAEVDAKRISVEFVKGPMKCNDKDRKYFTALYDSDRLEIARNRKFRWHYPKKNNACHTKGILNNFLKTEINESIPVLFENPEEVIDKNISFLNLKKEETEKFFGISVDKATCHFPLTMNKKEYLLESYSNLMLVGGKFVSGEIRVPCKKTENELEFTTFEGYIKSNADIIKAQWIKNGFSRLFTEYDENTKELIIRFYTE